MALKNLFSGIIGNLSEQNAAQLETEYGMYLMDGEVIATGFKLIRDVIIFTDKRILFFDKQGTTGQKMRIESIYLSTIIKVTVETAGFGVDDSEITVTYITSPYLASLSPTFATKTFEFPKKYNVQALYARLEALAYENHQNINK